MDTFLIARSFVHMLVVCFPYYIVFIFKAVEVTSTFALFILLHLFILVFDLTFLFCLIF